MSADTDRFGERPWQDKELLEQLYVMKEFDSKQISERFDCTSDTVVYWLRRYFGDNPCPDPTCDEQAFLTVQGMKTHYKRVHGDTIEGVVKECSSCGTNVRRQPSNFADSGRVFCSDGCELEWRRDYYNSENHPCSEKVSVECYWCGETIMKSPYHAALRDRHFHKECFHEWYRLPKQSHGPNNPNWKGKYSKTLYDVILKSLPHSWKESKSKIRSRDEHICALCERPESDLTQKLHAHHIVPILAGGCNEDELGMLLCPGCHVVVESYTSGLFTPLSTIANTSRRGPDNG